MICFLLLMKCSTRGKLIQCTFSNVIFSISTYKTAPLEFFSFKDTNCSYSNEDKTNVETICLIHQFLLLVVAVGFFVCFLGWVFFFGGEGAGVSVIHCLLTKLYHCYFSHPNKQIAVILMKTKKNVKTNYLIHQSLLFLLLLFGGGGVFISRIFFCEIKESHQYDTFTATLGQHDQTYTPTQWSVIVLCPMDHACFFCSVTLA